MARLRAGHARPLRNMVMWDVGRPAPRPPGRLAAMRSLTDRRCRGRRPRRPAEVGGGGRCAGGMNPSPTGYPLAVVCREAAEGSRPLPTMQKINGRQWQGCGPGMPGPYGLPQMGCAREGQGRAAARPFAVGGGCPETGGDAKPVGIPQAASAASPSGPGPSVAPRHLPAQRGVTL